MHLFSLRARSACISNYSIATSRAILGFYHFDLPTSQHVLKYKFVKRNAQPLGSTLCDVCT
jgi:hypothetical protein